MSLEKEENSRINSMYWEITCTDTRWLSAMSWSSKHQKKSTIIEL